MKVITKAFDKSLQVPATQDIDGETEWDEEISQISSTHLTWKAYCEWLKLMVVHFDAVHILISHMKTIESNEVTIKVITAPYLDTTLLPWKELLKNKRYFDDPIGMPSSSDIIAFIEKWQGQQTKAPHDVIKLFEKFCGSTLQDPDHLQEIIDILGTMGSCQSPGYLDIVNDLIATLQTLKLMGDKPGPKLVKEIMNELRSLRDRALFFIKLKGLSFKQGSLHCELNLTCFMMPKLSKLIENTRV